MNITKNEKNLNLVDFRPFFDKISIFFVFCDIHNFLTEGRTKCCDLSFCSEFYALSDGIIENQFSQSVERVHCKKKGTLPNLEKRFCR
jgi:hypothetical protein